MNSIPLRRCVHVVVLFVFSQDAMDQLLTAADTIVEVISPSLEDDGLVGEGSTDISKSQSRGSGSRAGGSASRVPTKRTAGSVKSGVKSVAGSTVAPPSTLGGSKSASRAASTVGGGKSGVPPSDWPARIEIRHFEVLTRIMVDLARMAPSGADRAKYLLLASYYIEQMWSLTILSVNTAAAEKVRLVWLLC
jgi:hypothetical protein